MRASKTILAPGIACLILFALPLHASDPHGHAAVSFEWVDDPGQILGADERVLRVVVKAAVQARSVRLGYESPDDITVSVRLGVEPAPPGTDGLDRVRLGDLARHQSKTVEFVVQAPPTKSGVAVFTVSGEVSPGREFEEKVGWTVGTPTAPTIRHGAAEFPARIEPE